MPIDTAYFAVFDISDCDASNEKHFGVLTAVRVNAVEMITGVSFDRTLLHLTSGRTILIRWPLDTVVDVLGGWD